MGVVKINIVDIQTLDVYTSLSLTEFQKLLHFLFSTFFLPFDPFLHILNSVILGTFVLRQTCLEFSYPFYQVPNRSQLLFSQPTMHVALMSDLLLITLHHLLLANQNPIIHGQHLFQPTIFVLQITRNLVPVAIFNLTFLYLAYFFRVNSFSILFFHAHKFLVLLQVF